MARAARFDPTAWARNQPRPLTGRRCEACTRKGVPEALAAVMAVMASGEARPSVRQMHEMLVRQYGFRGSENALVAHLHRHGGEAWRAARQG